MQDICRDCRKTEKQICKNNEELQNVKETVNKPDHFKEMQNIL